MYSIHVDVRPLRCFAVGIFAAYFSNALSLIAQTSVSSGPTVAATAPEEAKPPIVLAANTVVTRDVVYSKTADPLQTLDIYSPKNAKLLPVVVFIHGGGWSKRDKDEVGAQPKLFNEAGIVVVSINYRLVPTIRYPENAQDVATAIAWLYQNIENSGGDPKKIVLMGHSAGSHLAALIATDDRFLNKHGLHRDQLAGVISLDGSAFDIPDRIQNGAEKIAENCRLAFGESLENQIDGSPLYHIKGKLGLPAFLLIYLKNDSLNHKQSKRFGEDVVAAGGKATLSHVNDGKTHQALCDDLGTESDHTGSTLIQFIQSVTR